MFKYLRIVSDNFKNLRCSGAYSGYGGRGFGGGYGGYGKGKI